MKLGCIVISKYLFSCFIGLEWKLGFYYSESIESPMHMSINCQVGCTGSHSEIYLCCLDSNSWELGKLFYSVWYFSTIYIYDIETSLVYISRFSPEESYALDVFSDSVFSHFYAVLWGFEMLKKGCIYFIDSFVSGLSWHDDSYEKLKIILMIEFYFSISVYRKEFFFDDFDSFSFFHSVSSYNYDITSVYK